MACHIGTQYSSVGLIVLRYTLTILLGSTPDRFKILSEYSFLHASFGTLLAEPPSLSPAENAGRGRRLGLGLVRVRVRVNLPPLPAFSSGEPSEGGSANRVFIGETGIELLM